MITTAYGKPVACPSCQQEATAVTGERAPAAGDWTVCAFCINVLRFANATTLRLLTLEDIEELKRNRSLAYDLFKVQRLLSYQKGARG